MVAAGPGHGNHGSVSEPAIPNAQIAAMSAEARRNGSACAEPLVGLTPPFFRLTGGRPSRSDRRTGSREVVIVTTDSNGMFGHRGRGLLPNAE